MPLLHQTTPRNIVGRPMSSRHIRRSGTVRARQGVTTQDPRSRLPMIRTSSAFSASPRVQSPGTRAPIDPRAPMTSVSTFHLQSLLENIEMDQFDTFGAEELRDGFFDATFYQSIDQDLDGIDQTPDDSGRGLKDLFHEAIREQIDDTKSFFTATFSTQDGLCLLKAFLGYFVAYVLCLIPRTQVFLGRYSYWAAIAALVNHSGRSMGSQIDGTVGCIVGGVLGLAMGCLSLELTSFSDLSKTGYGRLLTIFLIILMAGMGWIRCTLLRFYQAMITAGLAMIFLCLAKTDYIAEGGTWDRSLVAGFAFPWLTGQGICIVINIGLYPDTGGRAVAIALHKAISSSLEALILPRAYSLEIHRNMSEQLVKLSDCVRDMRLEIVYTPLKPDDVEKLQNLLQAAIGDIMAIKPETDLFEKAKYEQAHVNLPDEQAVPFEIEQDESEYVPRNDATATSIDPLQIVRQTMAGPAERLIVAMKNVLYCCDVELMAISGFPELCSSQVARSVITHHQELKSAQAQFDDADVSLIGHSHIPSSYSSHPELVELFLFIHPLRQAASAISELAVKVIEISSHPQAKMKQFFLPSYPLRKAIYRTNPQVRHDRGGVSAGYYFRIKQEIDNIMTKIHAQAYLPDSLVSNGDSRKNIVNAHGIGFNADENTLRYRIWKILHRLQQFESQFAFKVFLVTGILSIPAWLEESRSWWSEHEIWWTVVAAWFMMHPRVGGNAQDLVTRAIAAFAGALWGGLSYKASSACGSSRGPYVIAAFAAVFMIPAVFRFMLSNHPRSGLMACLSFTVVSLSSFNNRGAHSAAEVAWSRGSALVVGVISAVVVNWLVWPFVARHELRKSLSDMLINLGIAYRGVVARYIYHDSGHQPTREDIEMSEIQESKMREYCFRMRELLEMTRHEIRPRGPFNPVPYNKSIDACERFLEHVVEVRKASLFFQAFVFRGSVEATRKMMAVRRDAVASILMNLYVLAGALRSKRPVPKYLPSAAAARKRLLDRMGEVEAEQEADKLVIPRPERSARWADVYHYAYTAALTDIVAQVELLERLTKSIVGEMVLDAPDLVG